MATISAVQTRRRRNNTRNAARLLVLIAALAITCLWLAVRRPIARQAIQPVDTGYRIPINQADRHELMLLPGIGPTLADHLVAYRQEHGPFTETSQLQNVHRIGVVTAERIEPWVTFDREDAAAPPQRR